MKRLTTADIKTWEAHVAGARSAFEEIQKAYGALSEALDDFNAKVTEAESLATTWADDAEAYQQERSERWQESDVGQTYSTWAETLRGFADQIEQLDLPDEPEEPSWLDEEPPLDPDCC